MIYPFTPPHPKKKKKKKEKKSGIGLSPAAQMRKSPRSSFDYGMVQL